MTATASGWTLRSLGVALALVCTVVPAIGWASGVGECKAAIDAAKSAPRRNGATAFVIGDQRVVVANTEEGGLVCAFAVAGEKISVSDVATGVDEVGNISDPRLIEGQRRTFLATVQTFRGGSNSTRKSHVLYAVESGKLHKALELASHEELAIGDYRLSERNALTPTADGLRVAQETSVRRASARGREALYTTSRRFVLSFAPEFRAFVEGTGECVQDLVIGKGVWLKSGQRFGYLFRPGVADAAALGLKLIRPDGAEANLEDAADLVFLRLGGK